MDDRELEARLADRLRARFDGVQPSASLRTQVEAVAAPRPRAAWRGPSVAWVAAAAVVIAVVVGVGMITLPSGGPPDDGRSPSPSPTEEPLARYVVLPAFGVIPTKADTEKAADVFAARLRALGIANFTSSAGDGIFFTFPALEDRTPIWSALALTGEIEVVGLAGTIADTVAPETLVGKNVPDGAETIAGPEDVLRAERTTDQNDAPALNVVLAAESANRLAAYTTDHVMSWMAILVDREVVLVASIRSAITGGEILVTGEHPDRLEFVAAMSASGRLPEAWQGQRVPIVMPEAEARRLALAEAASMTPPLVRSAQLGTAGFAQSSAGLVPTWEVTVEGSFPSVSCGGVPSTSISRSCPTAATALVVMDAVTGDLLEIDVPAP